ncbi:hypothetical protein RBSWK_01790 [Rhodopirellula baltica SWK14]|uniref:Uncharacterized protein n=1 Tax=Rhodopirellula baltica SWK14 TaxID=993516 RepID=L7CJN9_RHOBT|nr:hypothetical protein RBSWK_01790 [Rhodopirellula baltica SWK14]
MGKAECTDPRTGDKTELGQNRAPHKILGRILSQKAKWSIRQGSSYTA